MTYLQWQLPPVNRWAFANPARVLPVQRVEAGGRSSPIDWQSEISRLQLVPPMGELYLDAMLVMHRGSVVLERYSGATMRFSRHMLMSITKSVVTTVAATLAGSGRFDLDTSVSTYVPELAGSDIGELTPRTLVDMTANLEWSERYGDARADVNRYERLIGWQPAHDADDRGDVLGFAKRLRCRTADDRRFAYQSVLTTVLGVVLERTAGMSLSELISDALWTPIGAECDGLLAYAGGIPIADGGLCATARDVARFGQLILDDGRYAGRQVIPSGWIRQCVVRARPTDPESGMSAEYSAFAPAPFYGGGWWVFDRDRAHVAAFGVFGQGCVIDPGSGTVIVLLASWPSPTSDVLMGAQFELIDSVVSELGEPSAHLAAGWHRRRRAMS